MSEQTFKVGDEVRFAHERKPMGRVLSVDADNMVEVEGWTGLFAAHLLRVCDDAEARARKLGAELWPVEWEHAESGDGWVNVGNQHVTEFVEIIAAALRDAQCPYVVKSGEGTAHCSLAESDAKLLAAAEEG